MIPEPFVVRRLLAGIPILRPPRAGVGPVEDAFSAHRHRLVGRRARRAALGDGGASGSAPARPSTGGTCNAGSGGCCASPIPTTAATPTGAAERIAELTEARELLLEVAPEEDAGLSRVPCACARRPRLRATP